MRGAVSLGYLGEPIGAPVDLEIATGDLGEFDSDGFLYVRGRRKNLLITSLGRNLSPEWIARELLVDPAIGQAAVFGDAQPHPVALIVPSRPSIDSARVQASVASANDRLPAYARVRAWRLATAPFSVCDDSLTPNGRLRRQTILHRDAALVASLYETAIAS